MSWNPFTRMFHQFKIKGFMGSKYGWMDGRICSSKSSYWSRSKFLLTRKVGRSPPKRQNTTEASRLSSMVFNGQPLDSSLRRYPPGPHRVRQMYRRTQKKRLHIVDGSMGESGGNSGVKSHMVGERKCFLCKP